MTNVEPTELELELRDTEFARLGCFGLLILTGMAAMPFCWRERGPNISGMILICVSVSLAAMTAVHFSVCVRSFQRRLLTIFLLVANGLFLGFTLDELLLGLVPLLAALPVWLVLEAIQFRLGTFSRLQSTQKSFHEGLQFQIWHILVATSVIALICVIIRAIAPFLKREIDSRIAYILFIISVTATINTLAIVWATMGNIIGWRIGISLAITTGTFVLGLKLVGSFQDDLLWFGMVYVPWLASMIYLILLRRSSYRFVRAVRQNADS